MKYLCLLLLPILLVVKVAFAQANSSGSFVRTYAITSKGEPAGTMTITQKTTGANTLYEIAYTLKGTMIIDYMFDVKIENRFQGNVLTYGKIYRLLNSSVRDDNEITRQGNTYVLREGKKNSTHSQPITYTVARMYFKEPPASVTKVFSEAYLSYLDVKRLGDGKYKTAISSGGSLLYEYKNGILYRLTADTTFGDAVFTLIK